MSETLRVESGRVVAMQYSLQVDGEMIDASEEGAPLEYLHGFGNIIPGLEREMEGLKIGESKHVIVKPEDGYGERDEEAFIDVPRSDFPTNLHLEEGTGLRLEGEHGEPIYARIDRLDENQVRLDFNHPLAGKELHFDVKVVGLRAATEEELEHGHPHSHGQHS